MVASASNLSIRKGNMTVGIVYFDISGIDKITKLLRASQAYAKQSGGKACQMILVSMDFLAGIEPALLLPLPFEVRERSSIGPGNFWAICDEYEIYKELVMDTEPKTEDR